MHSIGQKWLGKTPFPDNFFFWNPAPRIHRSHLCAGGEEERDTCTGDGGDPLLCAKEKDGTTGDSAVNADAFDLRGLFDENITLVQAGITAWGIGCGRAGIPAVYTDLASAACWLDQVTS